MCTSLVDLTMENSTVEKEIADFDIEAPISVTVCLDEDFDENPIKTEIVTDDYQKQEQKGQEIDNSAFIPILETKNEIQDETCAPNLTEELNQYIENIISNTTELVQDKVTNNSTPNKRKTDKLQNQNQTKRGRRNECDSGDKNNCKIHDNDSQKLTKNTNEIAASIAITSFDPDSIPQNAEITASLSEVTGLHQNELNKINAHVTKCLTMVSENLRCIMKAYDYHKSHKTPPESFKDIKYNYFNLSYKTVVDILLPEEDNTEFIHSFLNDTLQRARKLAGPYYIRTFRDFANLVYEMFMWAKQQQQISQEARNSKNKDNDLVVNNSSIGAKVDKICIFSAGPPEREFSINVDPVISKYFQNTTQKSSAKAIVVQSSPDSSQNEPHKSKNNTDKFNSTAESLAKFAAKYRNNNSKTMQTPISSSQLPAPSTVTHSKQNPQRSPNATDNLTKNMLNNTTTDHPRLASLLKKPSVPPFSGVSQPLQQQQESQRPPPPYEQYLQMRVESAHPVNQYDPMRYLQTQYNQQQQISMQYSQSQLIQSQQIQAPSGSLQQSQVHMGQTQPMPQHGVSMIYQAPWNQHQMPRYKQTKLPQVGPSKQYMQQPQQQQQLLQQKLIQQQPTERGGPISSIILPPLPSFNNIQVQPSNFVSWDHLHKSQSGEWQPQNNQPRSTKFQQIQPAKQTDWHQELNAIYQVGQAPQQAHKGSPRSASTDSGFISPLNFNAMTEQTVPTVPEESESIVPVITHVTSLNDKASFVESGSCAVCKKSTKQMCMGCMKIYYCTYQCQNSSSNVLDDQDYTFKHYYYPVSDGDDSLPSVQDGAVKRKINTSSDIDAFFDQPKTKKKKNIFSTVGQGRKGGGISYVSTNKDDSSNSAHLIKIEIFDMKKLAKVSDTREHWKHAGVRVKYYVKEKEKNKHLQLAKDLIYRITKEIAESDECKKYHFNLLCVYLNY